MTGTGTQQDPFVISNWADFITAVGTTDAYVEFPKNIHRTRDIDVNPNKLYIDEYGVVQTNVQPSDLRNLYENTFKLDANSSDGFPEGLPTTIAINCAEINAYGATVINLASSTVDLFTNNKSMCVLSNLALLNFNVDGHAVINTAQVLQCFYCIFSGRVKNNTSSRITAFGRNQLDLNSPMVSCSFNIIMEGNIDLFDYIYIDFNTYGGLHRNCRIEVHKTNNENSVGGTFATLGDNSYYTGDISGINNAIVFTNTSQYNIVEIDSATASLSKSGNISLVLVNTDIFTSNNITGNFNLVDTQTLGDANALLTLGFPIET